MLEEVGTDAIIEELLAQGKRVYLPRVEGDAIRFYRIRSLSGLKLSAFGIREPQPIEPIDPKEAEVIVCPGLAFDKAGNRLGYGGGYYDRYLKDCPAKRIGVCFKEQLFETIPHKENDVPMDAVITD